MKIMYLVLLRLIMELLVLYFVVILGVVVRIEVLDMGDKKV